MGGGGGGGGGGISNQKKANAVAAVLPAVPRAVPPAVPQAVPPADMPDLPIAIYEITAGDVVVHVALPQPRTQSQLTTSS